MTLSIKKHKKTTTHKTPEKRKRLYHISTLNILIRKNKLLIHAILMNLKNMLSKRDLTQAL